MNEGFFLKQKWPYLVKTYFTTQGHSAIFPLDSWVRTVTPGGASYIQGVPAQTMVHHPVRELVAGVVDLGPRSVVVHLLPRPARVVGGCYAQAADIAGPGWSIFTSDFGVCLKKK